jgi:putative PEP-CTERM system histidine kinase
MLIISVITAVLAILIALAVIFKRYDRITNIVFSIGLLSTASVIFGDSMSLFRPEYMIPWKRIVFISEASMAIAWLIFSLSFARTDYWRAVSTFSRIFTYLSPVLVLIFVLLPVEDIVIFPALKNEKVLSLNNMGYIFYLVLLFYSILSIINLEATLRSSRGKDRWEIKHTVLGVGAILAINIFYYSHALLYLSINMHLLPVRTGVILTAVLMIGFSFNRNRTLDTEFAVSRKILYRSLSLIIVGIYLLVIGLLGEGMRYFGPHVGKNITTLLGFIGAIIVLIVIFSEQLRSRAKVYINKHFFSQKYDYREQWLQFTQRISLKYSFDELLTSIARGFEHAIAVRGVAIWLKERDEGGYHCARDLDNMTIKTRPNREFLEFLREKQWILNVHDSKCTNVVSLSEEFIKETEASLIVPLFHIDDLMGFIILKEGTGGNDYNYEDYDLLKTLARQTAVVILNAKLSEELMESKEMEAMGRLSSFILHDLKNATSMLSLIVQNAEEHIDNPDFQRDAIKAVSNTSEKIKGIIGKLKNLPRKRELDLQYCDLGSHVKAVIQQLEMNENTGLSFKELTPVKAMIDREEITKVIINLIMNALDATNNEGKVEVTVGGTDNNMGYVKVSDNGCGISSKFIEKRLFKPFQTTKKKGLGIGLYQCKVIVENHSGKLKVSSHEGRGTDFFLYLPLA